MENINLTPLLEAVITVATAIITTFIIPWLMKKMETAKFEELERWIDVGVKCAEQIFETNQCDEKKNYVFSFLTSKGFTVDDTIDDFIEAKVLELHNALNQSE